MTKNPNSISAKDQTYHLHPYTNLKVHEEQGPLVISRGQGVRVFGEDGKEYIEGLSGLWCTSLGFNEPRLVKAAQTQMEKLPFYHSFSSKVPDVTAELAERLVQVTPDGLDRVFSAIPVPKPTTRRLSSSGIIIMPVASRRKRKLSPAKKLIMV